MGDHRGRSEGAGDRLTAPAGEAILRLESVAKTFRPRRGAPVAAVRSASLELRAGEVVGLVGPNGAGKTTVLRIAAGLLEPDAGRCLRAFGPGEIAWVAPADLGLYGRLAGRSVLSWFAALDEADGDAIEEAIETVGLSAVAGRAVRTYSAGERARLVLARAFLRPYRAYFLDEPLRSVDEETRARLGAALAARVRAAGAGAILVTHDAAEAARLSDRVLRMEGGVL